MVGMIRFDNWTINVIFNGNVIIGPLQLNAKFSVLLYFSSNLIYDDFRRSFTWNFTAMVC